MIFIIFVDPPALSLSLSFCISWLKTTPYSVDRKSEDAKNTSEPKDSPRRLSTVGVRPRVTATGKGEYNHQIHVTLGTASRRQDTCPTHNQTDWDDFQIIHSNPRCSRGIFLRSGGSFVVLEFLGVAEKILLARIFKECFIFRWSTSRFYSIGANHLNTIVVE